MVEISIIYGRKIHIPSIKNTSDVSIWIVTTVITYIKCIPWVWWLEVSCCVIAQNLTMEITIVMIRYKIDVFADQFNTPVSIRIISYAVCTCIKRTPWVWWFKVGSRIIAQNLTVMFLSVVVWCKVDVSAIKNRSNISVSFFSYIIQTGYECRPWVWWFKVGCCVIA